MSRVLVVILLLLVAAGAGLGVAWIYANMIYKPPPYSSPKNISPKNGATSVGNDFINTGNQDRDLSNVLVIAQSPSEGDYGKLINTSIENLQLKSFVISGNSANLTFSYLTSKGKISILSLNVKYGFAIGNGLYYLGSDKFPFKIGDKLIIQFTHVEKKGDTTNTRQIESIRNNKIATPEQKRAIEAAIGKFGDTVLTREDLTRRLEQGGNVRLEDNEIQVEYLNNPSK